MNLKSYGKSVVTVVLKYFSGNVDNVIPTENNAVQREN
jgi:hypothetical protein